MKQNYIEVQVKNQLQQSIKDAFYGSNQTIFNEKIIRSAVPSHPFRKLAEKVGSLAFCKGPPGQARSPGAARGHPPAQIADKPSQMADNPENKAVPPVGDTPTIFKYQIINTYQISNYYKHLNFIIMKKQILFLAMFTLALIFAATKSYGQYVNYLTGAPTCTPAVPLTCTSNADPLRPIPGATYDYTVTVNPAVATGGYVRWFVTTDSKIIESTTLGTPVLTASDDIGDGTGTYILLAEAAKYDLTTNLSPTIKISWKYFDGATQQVLLVAYVMDNNGCTNNVEVYRITPSFGFTLDMAALLDAGTPGSTECVSMVESATYDPGTPGNLTMNYGENWVYYSVNAANFVHSWMPAFTVVSYTGTGTVPVADIQWAYPADAQANLAWNAVTVPVLAKDASGAVGTDGECIVVRARIVHNKDQVLAATTLTLGVDGTMRNPAGAGDYTTAALKDMDNPTTGTTCVNDITDQKTYTITPRPTITDAIPNTPAATDFIPKN